MRLRGVAIALILWGCSSALTVGGSVVRPARVPVRAFPHIIIVASDTEESGRLALRLTEHLERGPSDVRTRSSDQIEALRARGALGPGTVVVVVRAALVEDQRHTWARRQELECGPLGCVESQRSVVEAVPVMRGHVRLTVTDGPTGRALQTESFEEQEVGADPLAMRLRVFERLCERTGELVDQRSEPVSVELQPVEAPAVRRALEAIRGGDWTRGAVLLDSFIATPAFAALPTGERARVLYDLGQARRFDPSLPPDERFARASEALRAAVRLAPEGRYATAIVDLEAHRRSRALVREQEAARTHNFRLARDGGRETIPTPPSSYSE